LPAGEQALSWLVNPDDTNLETTVGRFSRRDCSPCPSRAQCTRRQVEPRELVLQPRVEDEALRTVRRHEQTEGFKVQYGARAGVESTHTQAVRRSGLRHSRYIGLGKTRLQHVTTAAAVNLIRISEWCAGTPPVKTGCSPLVHWNDSEFATDVIVPTGPPRYHGISPAQSGRWGRRQRR
jgi:transposase